MTYAIGKEQILALCARFAPLPSKEFHDRLLAAGTIPFALAERAFAAR